MEADALYVWQDREIRFDAHPLQLECRKGEVIIDSMNSVEDTKGAFPSCEGHVCVRECCA